MHYRFPPGSKTGSFVRSFSNRQLAATSLFLNPRLERGQILPIPCVFYISSKLIAWLLRTLLYLPKNEQRIFCKKEIANRSVTFGLRGVMCKV